MSGDFTVVNIRTSFAQGKAGEADLKELLSAFSCPINPDAQRFLLGSAVDFTKRNQSVTYLLISRELKKLAGYFALTIKPISVNAGLFSNTMRRKIERVSEVNEQTGEYLVAAFLIAQLSKNFADGINEKVTGVQLLQSALDAVCDAQYRLGGTVVFLETQSVPQLLAFYERNGFKRFAVRQSHTPDQHKLVQLLRVL